MSAPLKILFLSAEVAPFAKTGGLGDVAGTLPKTLRAMGHDVRVIMPAYQRIEQQVRAGGGFTTLPGALTVPLGIGRLPAGVFENKLPGSDVPVYFIAERNLFDRPEIYGYGDDAYRFAFFSRAALDLTLALDWKPDIVHAHDWHSAPAVMWLATAGQADERFRGIPTLYTIHNLAHQGQAKWDVLNYLGVATHGLNEEPYGTTNFMARGIYHATMINTVSPTYAREIMTPDGGARLEGLLHYRSFDVHGILNGLDYDSWNPLTNKSLAAPFDADQLDDRLANKRALQARLGLPQKDNVPLVAMVSRLDYQKGLEIVGHVVHQLMNGGCGDAQFVVLGTGADNYEAMFRQMAAYHTDKMRAVLAFSNDLAPLIYGGSDLFLMPSRFEPCGLGQLIAMHMGCVPVVRETGGLADTVQDMVTGFTFYDFSVDAFWHALQRAIFIYNADRESWRKIQRNGMTTNFSWTRSANGYQQLYEWAIARLHGG
jgi:starch synthase